MYNYDKQQYIYMEHMVVMTSHQFKANLISILYQILFIKCIYLERMFLQEIII